MNVENETIAEYYPSSINEIIDLSNYEQGYSTQVEQTQSVSRFRRIAGRVAAAGALTVAMLTGSTLNDQMTEEAQAASPTCYGDYCSGQYPNDAHCDEDATTIATENVKLSNTSIDIGPISIGGEENEVGTLELRYSEICGTVWARLNTKTDSPIQFLGVEQDTGYRQQRNVAGRSYPAPPLQAFTPMAYGRGNSYRAYVYSHHPAGMPQEKGTVWTQPK